MLDQERLPFPVEDGSYPAMTSSPSRYLFLPLLSQKTEKSLCLIQEVHLADPQSVSRHIKKILVLVLAGRWRDLTLDISKEPSEMQCNTWLYSGILDFHLRNHVLPSKVVARIVVRGIYVGAEEEPAVGAGGTLKALDTPGKSAPEACKKSAEKAEIQVTY